MNVGRCPTPRQGLSPCTPPNFLERKFGSKNFMKGGKFLPPDFVE